MSIDLIVGPMFSGKTSELLRRIKSLENNHKNIVVCITHNHDTRYSKDHEIVSHSGAAHSAIGLIHLVPFMQEQIYKQATHIMIEEAQFFPDLFEFTVPAADKHEKHIVCAGLDGDFMRKPFGQLMDLVPHSESTIKLRANCSRCSEQKTAIFTARRWGNGGHQLYVGGKEVYEPMCRKHYIEYYYE